MCRRFGEILKAWMAFKHSVPPCEARWEGASKGTTTVHWPGQYQHIPVRPGPAAVL